MLSRILTAPLPGATINWGHPLANGLVGNWLLNEGAGIKARNSVKGGASDGTLTNFLWTSVSGWTGGKFGTCLTFNNIASNGCSVQTGWIPPTTVSFGGWYYSPLSNSTDANTRLCGNGDATAGTNGMGLIIGWKSASPSICAWIEASSSP